MSEPMHLRYDQASDVLYVSTDNAGPGYGEEADAPGLVWRYRDDDDSLMGVTVMDFGSYWRPRLPQLVEEFSAHFGLAPHVVRGVLEAALV